MGVTGSWDTTGFSDGGERENDTKRRAPGSGASPAHGDAPTPTPVNCPGRRHGGLAHVRRSPRSRRRGRRTRATPSSGLSAALTTNPIERQNKELKYRARDGAREPATASSHSSPSPRPASSTGDVSPAPIASNALNLTQAHMAEPIVAQSRPAAFVAPRPKSPSSKHDPIQ